MTTDTRESVQDLVCQRVRDWIERQTKQLVSRRYDDAELVLTLREAGWDDDETLMVDVLLTERRSESIEGHRLEGLKR